MLKKMQLQGSSKFRFLQVIWFLSAAGISVFLQTGHCILSRTGRLWMLQPWKVPMAGGLNWMSFIGPFSTKLLMGLCFGGVLFCSHLRSSETGSENTTKCSLLRQGYYYPQWGYPGEQHLKAVTVKSLGHIAFLSNLKRAGTFTWKQQEQPWTNRSDGWRHKMKLPQYGWQCSQKNKY